MKSKGENLPLIEPSALGDLLLGLKGLMGVLKTFVLQVESSGLHIELDDKIKGDEREAPRVIPDWLRQRDEQSSSPEAWKRAFEKAWKN